MNPELMKAIREEFQAKLSTKTGWGRNDVMAAYDQAVSEAALKMLANQLNKPQ